VPLYGELHRFIPALASWHGASICEIPIRNTVRERGESHYGLGRTLRVFFDLLTIRFLLRYLSRPLHFFGTIGMVGSLAGIAIALWLAVHKLLAGEAVMTTHGPLMIFGAVLILGGAQMIALGLLGEMHVHHYYGSQGQAAPYSVDQVLRASDQSAVPD
jgi:hypothetical protein